MRPAFHLPGLQGQQRLRTFERLDLRFLIDAEHRRVRQRIEIQADDIAHLLDEQRIIRQRERLDRGELGDCLRIGGGCRGDRSQRRDRDESKHAADTSNEPAVAHLDGPRVKFLYRLTLSSPFVEFSRLTGILMGVQSAP